MKFLLSPPIVAPPYPEESWFTQTWIYSTGGCFQKCFSFYDQISFWEKNFKLFFSIYCYANIWPPHCGLPYPRESWLKKKLPEDVSQMFPLLWPIGFWEEGFLKHFLYICHCVKIWPLIVRHLTPGDHDLNKLESTLHDDVSTQVTAFLVGRFLRIIYPTPDTVFIYLLINPIYSSVVSQ